MALPAEKTRYTFADVLEWPGTERMELIDGKIVMMAPPSDEHQRILFELCIQLGNYLKGKTCQARPAPYAVRLFAGREDRPEHSDVMVEPDISVICDPRKLDQHGCKGAPDMIIEILSPSSRRYDRVTKFRLYQQAGVREYWIVDPEDQTVLCFVLEGERYTACIGDAGEKLKIHVLENCEIDLGEVFRK